MIKLNVGSNAVLMDGWINMDIENIEGVVQHDATTKFPYEDNSVDFIFSEHFIEHLVLNDGVFFFSECYRILKPGGVVRTSTFDIDNLMINLHKDKWDEYKMWLYDGQFKDRDRIEFLNMAIYDGGNVHKYMYNPDEMIRLLKKAEFSTFNVPKMKESSYPELQNLEFRCNSDCVVEAVK